MATPGFRRTNRTSAARGGCQHRHAETGGRGGGARPENASRQGWRCRRMTQCAHPSFRAMRTANLGNHHGRTRAARSGGHQNAHGTGQYCRPRRCRAGNRIASRDRTNPAAGGCRRDRGGPRPAGVRVPFAAGRRHVGRLSGLSSRCLAGEVSGRLRTGFARAGLTLGWAGARPVHSLAPATRCAGNAAVRGGPPSARPLRGRSARPSPVG